MTFEAPCRSCAFFSRPVGDFLNLVGGQEGFLFRKVLDKVGNWAGYMGRLISDCVAKHLEKT